MMKNLAEKLNLTGEQQKLLEEHLKEQRATKAATKLQQQSEPVKKPKKAAEKNEKKVEHKDLGEGASVEDDEVAKDKIALAQAEADAQKAALESAQKEAKRLHDNDVALQKEVMHAAKKKDDELAKQDEELERASKAEDKLTSTIMGPKAS